MKLAICGLGRAGKDTAAEFLATCTPLRYVAGTSLWAADMVYDRMAKLGHTYAGSMQCWQDRHNHRELWRDIIVEYNRNDPVQLYKDCLAEQDILTGIRAKHEQEACKKAGLAELWLWIDRPGCVDVTCEVTPDDCDLTIRNYGTLEDFYARLQRFASVLNFGSEKTLTLPGGTID